MIVTYCLLPLMIYIWCIYPFSYPCHWYLYLSSPICIAWVRHSERFRSVMLRIDELQFQCRLTQKYSKISTYVNDNEVVVLTKMRFPICALALALASGALGINIDKSKYDEAMVLGADGQV